MAQTKTQSELLVITRAKELTTYIITVTEKSPKKFRFTLVSRLQNYSLDILEKLYLANDVMMNKSMTMEDMKKRRKYQQNAMTKLRLLAYIAMVARESQCILPAQYAQISEKAVETQRLLYSWEQSDNKRISEIRGK